MLTTNKKPSVVVPISGGMDSSVLLQKAGHDFEKVHAVSFNYGQKHNKELNYALQQVNILKSKIGVENVSYNVIDIPFFKDISKTSALTNLNIAVAKAKDVMGDPQTVNYVPFRNLMLLSISLAHAESTDTTTVWHGAAQADSIAGYWDGSNEFITKLNEVTALNRRLKIEVDAPLLSKSKTDIVILGIHFGVDFSQTWTCYEGGDEACGECTACSLRLQGFVKSGYIDPLPYKKEIDWNSYNCIPIY
jgi:7-cyano-7-deazaguanine synthase